MPEENEKQSIKYQSEPDEITINNINNGNNTTSKDQAGQFTLATDELIGIEDKKHSISIPIDNLKAKRKAKIGKFIKSSPGFT